VSANVRTLTSCLRELAEARDESLTRLQHVTLARSHAQQTYRVRRVELLARTTTKAAATTASTEPTTATAITRGEAPVDEPLLLSASTCERLPRQAKHGQTALGEESLAALRPQRTHGLGRHLNASSKVRKDLGDLLSARSNLRADTVDRNCTLSAWSSHLDPISIPVVATA
jgi:hypothetical protein